MTTFNSQKNVLKHLGEIQRRGGGPTHNPRMKKGADHSIFLKSHKVSQKIFEIFASNATRGAQKTIGNFLKNAKYAPIHSLVGGGGGLLFFRIHVKGVIEYFCDAGGGAGHFVQLLIEFCKPTPVINHEWSLTLTPFLFYLTHYRLG